MDHPNGKYMDNIDRLSLNLAYTEKEKVALQIANLKLKEIIEGYAAAERVRRLQSERLNLESELKSRSARIDGMGREFGEKYEVDFSETIYHPESGLLADKSELD